MMYFTLNAVPGNHVGVIGTMLLTMVKAGWTVLSWSDGNVAGGTTNGAPGPRLFGFRTGSDGLPIVAAQTGSLFNDRAWILLQQPSSPSGTASPYSGSRQFVFQHASAATTQWRIKYSVSGGYYPGPGATGTQLTTPSINPSIADEAIVLGGGTDNAPTFVAAMTASNEGQIRVNVMVDDGTSGSSTPYGVLMASIAPGGATVNSSFLFDPVQISSISAGIVDPFVLYVGRFGGSVFVASRSGSTWSTMNAPVNTQQTPQSWFRYPSGSFQPCAACYWSTDFTTAGPSTGEYVTVPNGLGANSWTTFDDLFPIPYAIIPTLAVYAGFKGMSSMLRWNGTQHLTGQTLSIVDPGTTRDRISLEDVNGPWDGSTIPLV